MTTETTILMTQMLLLSQERDACVCSKIGKRQRIQRQKNNATKTTEKEEIMYVYYI